MGRSFAARFHELLGHVDVKTTMIYTHVLERAGGRGIRRTASMQEAIGEARGQQLEAFRRRRVRSPSSAPYAAGRATQHPGADVASAAKPRRSRRLYDPTFEEHKAIGCRRE